MNFSFHFKYVWIIYFKATLPQEIPQVEFCCIGHHCTLSFEKFFSFNIYPIFVFFSFHIKQRETLNVFFILSLFVRGYIFLHKQDTEFDQYSEFNQTKKKFSTFVEELHLG